MDRRMFWKNLLSEIGRGCMGTGGFSVDDQGRLTEDYGENEEDWPEEIYSGDESQDGEDIAGPDRVWYCTERGPS